MEEAKDNSPRARAGGGAQGGAAELFLEEENGQGRIQRTAVQR
jgi:hypothetical protein